MFCLHVRKDERAPWGQGLNCLLQLFWSWFLRHDEMLRTKSRLFRPCSAGTSILKGVDDYMSLLDEHITMTQAMTFSTFKGPFEERIENWNSTLQVQLAQLLNLSNIHYVYHAVRGVSLLCKRKSAPRVFPATLA